MAVEGYVLSKSDVDILRRIVDAFQRGNLTLKSEGLPPLTPRSDVVFGVADASIAGTTGTLTTPGSGTLNVYKFTSTGGTTVTTRDETVYNLSTVARTTDEFTIAVRDFQSGRWMAVAGSGDSSSYKPLIDFVLDSGLNTTDASATALIVNQFGPGTAHSTTSSVTVLQGPGDMYFGSSGTYGQAVWNTSRQFKIIQLTRTCTT